MGFSFAASVEQSCEEIGSSGTFFIDPDGSGPMGAVQVDCEIDDGKETSFLTLRAALSQLSF